MSETNPPPVAPVEGHLYLLFTEYENTINIRKWSQEPFDDAVEYVRKSDLAGLITACDLALDWADANARAFPIETAPTDRDVLFWDDFNKEWQEFRMIDLSLLPPSYTHWREPLPPPSNPPLPEPLEALGAVLRRVKGVS